MREYTPQTTFSHGSNSIGAWYYIYQSNPELQHKPKPNSQPNPPVRLSSPHTTGVLIDRSVNLLIPPIHLGEKLRVYEYGMKWSWSSTESFTTPVICVGPVQLIFWAKCLSVLRRKMSQGRHNWLRVCVHMCLSYSKGLDRFISRLICVSKFATINRPLVRQDMTVTTGRKLIIIYDLHDETFVLTTVHAAQPERCHKI